MINIYIMETLNEERTVSILKELDTMNTLDMIANEATIYLSSHGGCCKSALTIFAKIQELQAEGVILKLNCSGIVASSGVYIMSAFANEDIRIHKDTIFITHQPNNDMSGTVQELQSSFKLTDHYNGVMRRGIKRFISKEQLAEYDLGLDVYINKAAMGLGITYYGYGGGVECKNSQKRT